MANQIGSFFEARSDRTEALEGIAQHIRKFWGAAHAVRVFCRLGQSGANVEASTVETWAETTFQPSPGKRAQA